ncbi:MAG: hypothetical protein CL933_00510 [Deltaproteobacteria bacterium]|nr:hypothetical protein [Deltaproteobacteria bacterium]
MLNLILAIPIAILAFFFADEKAANIAAHEICTDAHVVKATEGFDFSCDKGDFNVVCVDSVCTAKPIIR